MKTIKKTKAKSLLSLLLVLVMILSAMPLSGISAFAATSGDFEYEILEDGTAEITGYSGWGGSDLIIPSNIDGYIVSSIGVEAFSFKTTITSVTIPDTVTQIKQQAFMYCYNLSDIKLSSNLIGIGAFAFLGCAFDSIELPESLKKINSYAFGMCVNLNSIKIPANVEEIEIAAFSDCISLEKITVDTKNENYCDIDGVLYSKDKTTLIAFPNFLSDSYEILNTTEYISNNAFSNCNNLVGIIIPDSVKEIGFQAFYGCSALKNVQMSDGLEVIGESAFENCSALNSIVIPSGVKEISSASFSNCTALENVQISDGVEIIGEAAFADCNSLNNINIPSSVEEIRERALVRCTSLEKITVDLDNKNYCDIDGVLLNKSKTELIVFPNLLTDVYAIPNTVITISVYAFANCDNLVNVNIPHSVKEIKDEAFYSCSSLKTISIPGSVKEISPGAFSYCTSLEEVRIEGGVETISAYAFAVCDALCSVDIPESVTSIGDYAFACEKLKEITIPESVTSIGLYALGYDSIGGKSANDPSEDNEPLFKIYGYEGTAAEAYANENGFEFIVLDKTVDESTGISISEKELNIIPDGEQLKAEKLSVEDNRIVFDISLVKDGTEVQPNGTVTVKIPVPESMDISLLKVYREEADGTFTDMNAYFANGYMVFTTDHFSKYILTTEEPSSALPGDINGDGKVTAVDARWILQIVAGTRQVTEAERKSVDLNKDGKVTAVDARWVLQVAAGTRVL